MSLSLGILSHIRGQIDGYLVDIIDIIYYECITSSHITSARPWPIIILKSHIQLFRFVICQLPQLVSIGLGEIFFYFTKIFLGGSKYHAGCHKCSGCGRVLAPSSAHLHRGQLHCRRCHALAARPPSPALAATDTARIPAKQVN